MPQPRNCWPLLACQRCLWLPISRVMAFPCMTLSLFRSTGTALLVSCGLGGRHLPCSIAEPCMLFNSWTHCFLPRKNQQPLHPSCPLCLALPLPQIALILHTLQVPVLSRHGWVGRGAHAYEGWSKNSGLHGSCQSSFCCHALSLCLCSIGSAKFCLNL